MPSIILMTSETSFLLFFSFKLKLVSKELTAEVTKNVTEQLRESYVDDVTAIVKECLQKSEFLVDAGSGYITIEALCKKYGVSRKTVTDKCRQFKEGAYQITRKWVNGHNTVNEKQYVEACNISSRKFKPGFLTKKKAA